MSTRRLMIRVATVVLSMSVAAGAFAQATRTWISGVGDDANPCSRTAPCKTLAGAISKTAAGGEIDALDPGGYGALTITKAITIDGNGVVASTLVSGTNGIVISAGVSDAVTIRNWAIMGLNTGLDGIKVLSAGSVTIDHCTIQEFTGKAVNIALNGGTQSSAQVQIKDSTFFGNAGSQVTVLPAAGAPAVKMGIANTRIFDGAHSGIFAGDGANISVVSSSITHNDVAGLTTSGTGVLSATESDISGNGQFGVQPSGGAIRLANCQLVGNGSPSSNAANTLSFGNNYFDVTVFGITHVSQQ